jgi:hypothetical protein
MDIYQVKDFINGHISSKRFYKWYDFNGKPIKKEIIKIKWSENNKNIKLK